MKIQSSFNDFYDYAAYYLGEDTYYKRETNDRQLENICGNIFYKDNPSLNLDELDKAFNKYRIYTQSPYTGSSRYVGNEIYNTKTILILGEKVIPFYIHTIATYIPEKGTHAMEYAIARLHQLSKAEQTWLTNNFIDLYNAVRSICQEPIILFSSIKSNDSVHDRHKLNFGTTINPQLKQIKDIQSLLQPEQIIQELELYLNKEQNIVHITDDKTKRDSAGFDEYSFKHKKG